MNDFSFVPPYTIDQITQIKGVLAGLKEPPFFQEASYRDQIHLAFYQGDQLRLYHYSKNNAPTELKELLRLLKLSLLDN